MVSFKFYGSILVKPIRKLTFNPHNPAGNDHVTTVTETTNTGDSFMGVVKCNYCQIEICGGGSEEIRTVGFNIDDITISTQVQID
jgi:hypothetical protein